MKSVRRGLRIGVGLLLLALGLGWWLRGGAAVAAAPGLEPGAEPAVSVEPPADVVPVGAHFPVTVTASGLPAGISGFEFDLAYDPALLAVRAVESGAFLQATGRQVSCAEPSYPAPGTVRFACASAGEEAGPAGSGTLAVVTFTALEAGVSDLDLVAHRVVGAGLPPAEVTVTATGGQAFLGVAPHADWSDLPSGYGVAWHRLSALRLGATVDEDATLDAGADDASDDGVTRAAGARWAPGNVVTLTVEVRGGAGYLAGWFDWNGDGSFSDPEERALARTVISGTHAVTLTVSGAYTTGAELPARLRLYAAAPETLSPTGGSDAGEVEDYLWHYTPTAASLHGLAGEAGPGGLVAGLLLLGLAALIWCGRRSPRRAVALLLLFCTLASALPVTAPVRASRSGDEGPGLHGLGSALRDEIRPERQPERQPAAPQAPLAYPTDLDGDGDVDLADVTAVAARWNCAGSAPCYAPTYDLDGSGGIDVADMAWAGNDYDVIPPEVAVVSPARDDVRTGTTALVTGLLTDTHAVLTVTVNGVAATVTGGSFEATVPVSEGNQLLDVVAWDALGQVGFASRVFAVDASGPMVAVHAPRDRQAVYTLTPTVAISYTDFYAGALPATLSATLTDAAGSSRDVTGDLAVAASGAAGVLSTPLAEDTSYTLTVTVDDDHGNTGTAVATFYVPEAPESIVVPEQPADAGWVSGVIYDSSSCDEHLTTCAGLPGASVTLVYSGGVQPVTGTIVTGPGGFFAFPVAESADYWVRVEKAGYTYGQRQVRVTRERSSALDEIYLTPIDPAVSIFTGPLAETASHTNSDGTMQLEIPPEAVAPGQVVTVTATNFEHVEFLPSGELPPGTEETYAFNLGGASEITFTAPITVRLVNYRGFSPTAEIPLGYWNQETMQWEHKGFGVIDPTGTWVVMTVTHFSNWDCNDPVTLELAEQLLMILNSQRENNPDCEASEEGCTINLQSGTLEEQYALPSVRVLGEEVAPVLMYNSDRAVPSKLIDIQVDLDFPSDVQEQLGKYITYEVFIEGKKSERFVISNTYHTTGEAGRFRYLWDGRDAQGHLLPPGVYSYTVSIAVPYRANYCASLRFGGPPRCDIWRSNISVWTEKKKVQGGIVLLDAPLDNPLGMGWSLYGMQRIYKDDAGRLMVTDGERTDDVYYSRNDAFADSQPAKIVWTGKAGDALYSASEEELPIHDTAIVDVGAGANKVALSPDEDRAYVTNYSDNTISIVDVDTEAEVGTIAVGAGPMDVALSPDGIYAYVVNQDAGNLSVVNLISRQQEMTISVGGLPQGIAVAEDGEYAYVANYDDDSLSVVNLISRQEELTVSVGVAPAEVELSPDGDYAYVLNEYDYTLSMVDLVTYTEVDVIPTYVLLSHAKPQAPTVNPGDLSLALAPDGRYAYVVDDTSLTAIDLDSQTAVSETSYIGDGTIDVTVSQDGRYAYMTARYQTGLYVFDLQAWQFVGKYPVGSNRVSHGVTASKDGYRAYVATPDTGTLSILDVATSIPDRPETLLGWGTDIAITQDQTRAYVTELSDDTMVAVDLATAQRLFTVNVGERPRGVALSPDENYAYVTNGGPYTSGDDTISVVNLSTAVEEAVITVGDGPSGIAVSSDGVYAYVANCGSGTISVLDLNILQEVTQIPVSGGSCNIELAPDQPYAYVPNNNNDTLSILDLTSRQVVDTISVGDEPYDVAISPDGAYAYVTNEGSNDETVSIVNLETRQEEKAIPVGNFPQGIAVSPDGAYVYIADYYDYTLSVINLATHEYEGYLPTIYWPEEVALSGVPSYPTARNPLDHSTFSHDRTSDTFTRSYPDGTEIYFNTDGTHDYTLAPDGRKIVYTYNPAGSVATMGVVAPGESSPHWIWSFAYADGQLVSITDPAGRVVTVTIDERDHLTAITGPDATSRHYTYEERGLITHFTDEAGDTTVYEYDEYGRLVQVAEPMREGVAGTSESVVPLNYLRRFKPSDTGYPLINEGPVGTPGNPAPPAPSSEELQEEVTYGRGARTGFTNAYGSWIERTDALSRTVSYDRDGANNVVRLDMPGGGCVENTYDVNGNLLTKETMGAAQCALAPENRDPGQVQHQAFAYEPRFNQIKVVTDSLGHVVTHIYDYEEGLGDAGNLIRIEYPPVENELGQIVTPTVSYTYNALDLLETETDMRGSVTRYVYTQGTPDEASDGAHPLFMPGVAPVPGLLTQVIQDEGGLDQTTVYKDFNAAGYPGRFIAPGGVNTTTLTYDDWNRTLTNTDAEGVVTAYDYDVRGRLIREIVDHAPAEMGRNATTTYDYTSEGQLSAIRKEGDGLSVAQEFAYDKNGKLALTRDGRGMETRYRYDEADQLIGVIDAGESFSYTYTVDEEVETLTNAGGTVKRNVYDGLGRATKTIQDEGGLHLTTVYTYDLNGNLTATRNPQGHVTCYAYDDHGRQVSGTLGCAGEALTTHFAYDLNGNLIRETDPRGTVTAYEYDALGRRTLMRQDDGGLNLTTVYTYDLATGNLVALRTPQGLLTTYTYDAMNRIVRSCEDPEGLNRCMAYTYDRLGNLQDTVDPAGVIHRLEHNAFGMPARAIQDVEGQHAITHFGYDDALNRTSVTDPNGNTTAYTFTPRNRVATRAYADGSTVHYTYDGRGNVETLTLQDGQVITHTHDALGRLTDKTFSSGGSQHYVYDAVGRLLSVEQLLDGYTTEVAYGYNSVGDVETLTQTVDGLSWTVGYVYDYAGGVFTMTYPSGERRVYTLDAANRLDAVRRGDGSLIAGYDYADADRYTTLTHANGMTTRTDYDPLGRISRINSAITDFGYGYDAVGRRSYAQYNHKAGAPADLYRYDALGQLTEVWYGADTTDPGTFTGYDRAQSYDFDPVGNRLTVTRDGTPELYGPSDGERLLDALNRYGEVDGQSFTYDLRGNLLATGALTYTYDLLNRQTGAEGNGHTAAYVYNGLGRRMAKTVDGVTTYYVYDLQGRVLEERGAADQLLARYTYGDGIDEVVAMERGGTTYAYHHDALGSVVALTDGMGNLVEQYDYDVYGAPSIWDGEGNPLAQSAIGNPYLFTGRRYDPESGNYYYRARIYSPALGRFLSLDPLGLAAADPNLYRYVNNNPVNFTDPLGLYNKWLDPWNTPLIWGPVRAADAFTAGMSDVITFGGTTKLRKELYGSIVDKSHESGWFQVGKGAGVAWSLAVGGAPLNGARWAQRAVQGYRALNTAMDVKAIAESSYKLGQLLSGDPCVKFGFWDAMNFLPMFLETPAGRNVKDQISQQTRKWDDALHGPRPTSSVIQTPVKPFQHWDDNLQQWVPDSPTLRSPAPVRPFQHWDDNLQQWVPDRPTLGGPKYPVAKPLAPPTNPDGDDLIMIVDDAGNVLDPEVVLQEILDEINTSQR